MRPLQISFWVSFFLNILFVSLSGWALTPNIPVRKSPPRRSIKENVRAGRWNGGPFTDIWR